MDDPSRGEEGGTPATVRPQGQRSSVPSFLFISLILFMLTNRTGDEFVARHQYQDALRSLTYQLSNYTAWMNGTASNFTVPDRDPALAPLLDSFMAQGEDLESPWVSHYSNITGFIRGDAKLHNITPSYLSVQTPAPTWKSVAEKYMTGVNMTDLVNRVGAWNWTASNKVGLSVVEKLPLQDNGNGNGSEKIAWVHARIELTDANTSEDLKFEFEGVHFIANGSIYGFAESNGRPIDIRLLPSLVSEVNKNETARIVEPELSARINKLKNLIESGTVDQESSKSDEAIKSTCPFTLFAQINPVEVPEDLMKELEAEIQKPTGIWTVAPPKLSIRGLLISKECGVLYELTNTEGLRSRTFFRKVTSYAGTAAITYLILLFLLSRQMERSRTPSGISRVSRWSFLAQAMVDSVSFAGHTTFAILAEGRPSLSLIAPAFLASVLFVCEGQFAVLIYQIQIPENLAAFTPASTPPGPISTSSPNTPPNPGTAPTQTPANALPTPTVQTTPPSPRLTFFASIMQHLRSDHQTRLLLSLSFFLIIIFRVILSPTLSLAFVAITYSCFWLPQIVRSARRGRGSGLTKEYLLGTTICRLYLALYLLICPRNVLDVEPRPWAYLLASFVLLQVLVLILQEYLGPAFFLPKRFVIVNTYDYHPPMSPPDSESPDQSLGDCAICMDAIFVDTLSRRQSKSSVEKGEWDDYSKGKGKRKGKGVGAGAAGGLLNAVQMGVGGVTSRKNYSLAPCHHLFHTECLERWLAIKNICPQCRRPLPSL